jgi:hypothetical protein
VETVFPNRRGASATMSLLANAFLLLSQSCRLSRISLSSDCCYLLGVERTVAVLLPLVASWPLSSALASYVVVSSTSCILFLSGKEAAEPLHISVPSVIPVSVLLPRFWRSQLSGSNYVLIHGGPPRDVETHCLTWQRDTPTSCRDPDVGATFAESRPLHKAS